MSLEQVAVSPVSDATVPHVTTGQQDDQPTTDLTTSTTTTDLTTTTTTDHTTTTTTADHPTTTTTADHPTTTTTTADHPTTDVTTPSVTQAVTDEVTEEVASDANVTDDLTTSVLEGEESAKEDTPPSNETKSDVVVAESSDTKEVTDVAEVTSPEVSKAGGRDVAEMVAQLPDLTKIRTMNGVMKLRNDLEAMQIHVSSLEASMRNANKILDDLIANICGSF